MATTSYATVQEYKDFRNRRDSLDDPFILALVEAASRQVDAYCGRRFYLDDAVSTRTYEPSGDCHLIVDDFATTTGLVVVERGSTLTINSDFYVQPLGGRTSWGEDGPYYDLEKFYDVPWYEYDEGGTVSVTAKWGWPAVPAMVKQATLVLAADLFTNGQNSYGVVGLDNGAIVRQRVNSTAAAMLAPYRLGETAPSFGFA